MNPNFILSNFNLIKYYYFKVINFKTNILNAIFFFIHWINQKQNEFIIFHYFLIIFFTGLLMVIKDVSN